MSAERIEVSAERIEVSVGRIEVSVGRIEVSVGRIEVRNIADTEGTDIRDTKDRNAMVQQRLSLSG